MLVESVVNAKSIALIAQEAASNKIPFLGTGFFPEASQEGIELKYIKTYKGISPILAPSNFDAIPILRGRKGFSKLNTEMPFFREGMQITERDMLDLERIEKETDPYLRQVLKNIYDDTTTLVESAEVVPEVMRMQLLAAPSGTPGITISANGVNYTYNYDPDGTYARDNYTALSGTSEWSDSTNAKPLDDINDAKQALIDRGFLPRYILMNSTTWKYLMAAKQIESVMLTTNAAGTIYKTKTAVKTAIKEATDLDVIIYDKTYQNASGNPEKYYPDNQITILPEGALGKTMFGVTPEMRSARQVADVDVAVYGKGISIATKPTYGPPYKFETFASEIVLPSYERIDETYVMKVASATPSA